MNAVKNSNPTQQTNTKNELSRLRAAAASALDRGDYIIPLQPQSKDPLSKYAPHGYKSSSNDPQEALKAWDAGIDANYGIDCGRSNLAVVDVDYGFQSFEDFEAWRKEHDLPKTYSVRTGRRDAFGVQMYFRGAIPSGNFKLGNATGQIKSIGGYVVGAGSVHPNSGEQYVPIVDAPIVDTPEQIKMSVPAKAKTKKSSGIVISSHSDEIIPAGQRWNKLQQVAGRLRNAGLSEEGTEAALWDFLKTRCEDGENYPADKVQKLAAWAASDKCDAMPLPETESVDGDELIILRGSESPREELLYVSKPYLPAKLIALAGNSGHGKSPITRDMAACVSCGLNFPARDVNPIGPRSVVMLNLEDDWSDTILPSLDAMGADTKNIFYLQATRVSKNGTATERQFALDTDFGKLTNLIKHVLPTQYPDAPPVGLVIIDPVTNYLGHKKMNQEEEMRPLLMPLALLANEMTLAVITVHHFNSREKGTTPLQRIMGAKALHGVARFIYLVGPDPESESRYHHVLAEGRVALNTGTLSALRYHTELHTAYDDHKKLMSVRVIWDGTTDATSEEVVDPKSKEEKSILADLAESLREFLLCGKHTASECTEYLAYCGWNEKTLSRTAVKKKARVESIKVDGKAYWQLQLGQTTSFAKTVAYFTPSALIKTTNKLLRFDTSADVAEFYDSHANTMGDEFSFILQRVVAEDGGGFAIELVPLETVQEKEAQ